MNITVNVEDIDLTSVIREPDDYGPTVTLADVVASKLADRISGMRDEYFEFSRRVLEVRDEEIRAQVQPMIAAALEGPITKTNTYGEPTGTVTTLSEIIVAEAKALLTRPLDSYARDKGTVVQKMVADEVKKALGAEIAIAVKKARDAVGEQIGHQVAAAVKSGLRSS